MIKNHLKSKIERAEIAAEIATRAAQKQPGDVALAARADQSIQDLAHFTEQLEKFGHSSPYGDGKHSFVADVCRSLDGDELARSRMESQREQRSTMANFGGLVVPQFLTDRLTNSGYSSRPLCDLLSSILPELGGSIGIPRVTTPATASMQTTEGTAPTASNPVTTQTDFLVRTIFAEMDATAQAIGRSEGSGFDIFVQREVGSALDAAQEVAVINGSGAGQPVGLLNAGAATLSITGTTAADVLEAIARSASAVDSARGRPADLIVMAPRRWRWLLSNLPNSSAAIAANQPGAGIAGRILGTDVVVSGGVPLNLGTSTDEDRVLVTRRQDCYLGEAPVILEVVRNTAIGAPVLSSRIVMRKYFASGVVDTSGMQVLTGTGLKNCYA